MSIANPVGRWVVKGLYANEAEPTLVPMLTRDGAVKMNKKGEPKMRKAWPRLHNLSEKFNWPQPAEDFAKLAKKTGCIRVKVVQF